MFIAQKMLLAVRLMRADYCFWGWGWGWGVLIGVERLFWGGGGAFVGGGWGGWGYVVAGEGGREVGLAFKLSADHHPLLLKPLPPFNPQPSTLYPPPPHP